MVEQRKENCTLMNNYFPCRLPVSVWNKLKFSTLYDKLKLSSLYKIYFVPGNL